MRKHGIRVHVQEQPLQVLEALLEKPGDVVSREDLIQRLWPAGTHVDFDRGLNAAVTRLRQALSDSAGEPRYVETVAKRGYRFLPKLDNVAKPKGAPKRKLLGIALGLLVFLSAAGYWLTRAIPTASGAFTGQLIPITSDPGTEDFPSFSPDGTQIAYHASNNGLPSRIYIKLIGPGDPIPLTDGAVSDRGAAWSPHGRHIAFVRNLSEHRIAVCLVPALGGVVRQITELTRPSYMRNSRPLTWSPDSNYLIVNAAEHYPGADGIVLVNVETGHSEWLIKPLSDPTSVRNNPALSPDGRTLAFVQGRAFEQTELYLLSLNEKFRAAGEPAKLTSFGVNTRSPVWTSDGKSIVFSSNLEGTQSLWKLDTGSAAKPVRLLWAGLDAEFPAVTLNGRLAFSRHMADINIWRQEIPASASHTPLPSLMYSSTARDVFPDYSPDGVRVAFQSNRSGTMEIWSCLSEGTRCSQLTSFNALDTGSPMWSPDGKHIAFDSSAAGNFDVYVMDAAGGAQTRLTSDPSLQSMPSWSRDGKWIYFASAQSGTLQVWKQPAAGGGAIQVTRNGGARSTESADGRYLYYSKDAYGTSLWRCDPNGGGETKIIESISGRAFAVNATHIYYLLAEQKGGVRLRSLNIASGKDSLIASYPQSPGNGLSVSPDGRYVLFTRVDHLGSDLVMVENFR